MSEQSSTLIQLGTTPPLDVAALPTGPAERTRLERRARALSESYGGRDERH
jgi:hypothetical protein